MPQDAFFSVIREIGWTSIFAFALKVVPVRIERCGRWLARVPPALYGCGDTKQRSS
jgi:hypothetical protein